MEEVGGVVIIGACVMMTVGFGDAMTAGEAITRPGVGAEAGTALLPENALDKSATRIKLITIHGQIGRFLFGSLDWA